MSEGSGQPEWLVVGQISKPHGIKGELMVWPLTDRPDEVFAVGRELWVGDRSGEYGDDALPVTIEAARSYRRGWLVRFAKLASRAEVEELARRYLVMPAAEAAPLEDGEIFYHQLLGAEVVTVDGSAVGTVREVFETEPAHLLEVKGEERVHLIPFTQQVVREVDADRGRIVIDPPEGLLEL